MCSRFSESEKPDPISSVPSKELDNAGMAKIIQVTSSAHFKTILSSSTYVVVDFYADWCGPCKTIAPIFEHLATAEALPGRLAFAKVNVDSQSDVARSNSVSAMPTFLIFKNGSVSETIQGANAAALRSAVLAAAASASKGPAKQSPSFSSKGQVLGDNSSRTAPPRSTASAVSSVNIPSADTIVRFFGLYFTTLFSFDAEAAAQASPFNVANRGATAR